jgi:hypothetical protein
MIGQEALPENLVARCLDVLRILSPNERDLIRVVVEVVHELRDTSDPEEDITVGTFYFLSFHQVSSIFTNPEGWKHPR